MKKVVTVTLGASKQDFEFQARFLGENFSVKRLGTDGDHRKAWELLRRQQANAVIAARTRIVEGAVGMVQLALEQLSEKKVVELDEERKAAMVSNLLVVLCGDSRATPVVNTGTLYT